MIQRITKPIVKKQCLGIVNKYEGELFESLRCWSSKNIKTAKMMSVE